MPTCLSLDLSLIRINPCGSPVQIISWLGVHLNTFDGTIRATDERITKLSQDLAALSSYKSSSAVHVKRVASVAGQIISLSSCVGSVARIMTRFLFSVVNSAVSWDSEVFLSNDSLCEIEFWSNNVHVLNGKIYWGAPSLPVRVSCFSDASDSACGAFVESQPELTIHQNWSLAGSVRNSTWRELKAVCLRFFGILTTRTSNPFCATAVGNATYSN